MTFLNQKVSSTRIRAYRSVYPPQAPISPLKKNRWGWLPSSNFTECNLAKLRLLPFSFLGFFRQYLAKIDSSKFVAACS